MERAKDAQGVLLAHLLFLAHPGHELLLYDWLQRTKPHVTALTDGSGGSGHARTEASRSILLRQGAKIVEPFGAYPDWVVYRAILDGDIQFFLEIADRLFAAVVEHSIDTLISDQVEHYNPVHDLGCVLATVVARQLRLIGYSVQRLVCPIEEDRQDSAAYLHVLSPWDLEAKTQAVMNARGLENDVERLLKQRPTLLEKEALYELAPWDTILPAPTSQPLYELYGRRQLQLRGGGRLITYRDHVRPLAELLESNVGSREMRVRRGGARYPVDVRRHTPSALAGSAGARSGSQSAVGPSENGDA